MALQGKRAHWPGTRQGTLFHRLGVKRMVFLDDADRASERAIIGRWMREFANLRHEFIDCEKGCARLWMD